MMRWSRRIAILCGLGIVGCTRSGNDGFTDTAVIVTSDTRRRPPPSTPYTPDRDTAGDRLGRMGLLFDPGRVRPGDTIAGLVLEKIVATPTPMDSTLVGSAAFRGEIELTGATMRHPEADLANEACFVADSASAERLPRWAGDRRRVWFCFGNQNEARRALGPEAQHQARIIISNFVIRRDLTDAVNGAHFVRLVDDRAALLEPAAKDVVGFLRGDVGFDKIRVADTVVLYLSPEGGGTRRSLTREQLRKPSNWVIPSGRHTYAFAPPAHLTKLTAKAGRHFNCLEYALASRFPDLAKLPHVGVKLEPDVGTSCLQSWNTTFVFDASGRSPRLVAAVYDQWEW